MFNFNENDKSFQWPLQKNENCISGQKNDFLVE